MNFPSRRTPLALFFYYGFVGVVLGACHADAQTSELAPLRVDPALLGQPPLKPAAPVLPAQVSAVIRTVVPYIIAGLIWLLAKYLFLICFFIFL